MTTTWTLALAAALLWPARSIAAFDGIPLDRRAEAIVVGVVVPALWWLDRSFLHRRFARVLIAGLLLLKIGSAALVQEGWCARFSTTPPLTGAILTMPVDEPLGVLRSWDVRADWRAADPRCTAIFDRPYETAAAFPSWFLNVLDQLRPGRRDVFLRVTGAITVPDAGMFALATGEAMRWSGRIGLQDVQAGAGSPIRVPLTAGTHTIALDGRLTGDRWRFAPEWNGASAWRAASMTVAPTSAGARVAGRLIAWSTTLIVAVLVGAWMLAAIRSVNPGLPAWIWSAGASAALVAAGLSGRMERVSSLILLGSAVIPVAAPRRNARSAFLMIGLPWLALFVAKAVPLVGHVTAYSWDDWLAYQVAGARIYMHGFWLEGGTPTFDYQALYRWVNGLLHIVFGDSSVGETYADAAWLVAGSLTAFALVRAVRGFRMATIACAATLITFTVGTPWHVIGRGLSEITAAGLGFGAALLLMRAGSAGLKSCATIAAAGVLAVLMFYARVNHLLFALSLAALLLPLSTPARWEVVARAVRRSIPIRAAAVYAGVLAAGVALFAARTWWYTGVFSVLYGTSLKNNDTGLRLTTMFQAEPWRKVAHSLAALVWLNEPPRPDPRSLLVAAGVLVAVGALWQLPRLREVPAAIVLVVIGGMLSSFVAHTHGYPGRMSIHLVPFAVSAAIVAATQAARTAA